MVVAVIAVALTLVGGVVYVFGLNWWWHRYHKNERFRL